MVSLKNDIIGAADFSQHTQGGCIRPDALSGRQGLFGLSVLDIYNDLIASSMSVDSLQDLLLLLLPGVESREAEPEPARYSVK